MAGETRRRSFVFPRGPDVVARAWRPARVGRVVGRAGAAAEPVGLGRHQHGVGGEMVEYEIDPETETAIRRGGGEVAQEPDRRIGRGRFPCRAGRGIVQKRVQGGVVGGVEEVAGPPRPEWRRDQKASEAERSGVREQSPPVPGRAGQQRRDIVKPRARSPARQDGSCRPVAAARRGPPWRLRLLRTRRPVARTAREAASGTGRCLIPRPRQMPLPIVLA